MKTSTLVVITIIVVVVVVGIVLYANLHNPNGSTSYNSSTTSTSSTNSTSTNSVQPASTPVLNVGTNSTLGSFLTAANGMTLYAYAKDTPGVSNCTGTCAVTWPPDVVSSADGLTGATGITGSIGTIMRSDGTIQLTYNNEPLYFFITDVVPGDTKVQNLNSFAVVKP
jgi:predicted lipoprotein with Yx(FWY)xxD motif